MKLLLITVLKFVGDLFKHEYATPQFKEQKNSYSKKMLFMVKKALKRRVFNGKYTVTIKNKFKMQSFMDNTEPRCQVMCR
jgi:hypothetical protein